MTIARHNSIGIKQPIIYPCMAKVANLLLAGLDPRGIRHELHRALAQRINSDSGEERSVQTRTFAVNNLMNIWVTPDASLTPFRDAALDLLRHDASQALPIHWAMVCSAYPFWFNVARQTGRLLALQGQITQAQVVNRLIEQYGERSTISRYARYVLRSFVSWGVLSDTDVQGHYEANNKLPIDDPAISALLLEASLYAEPEGKSTIDVLLKSPGHFPFSLQSLNGIILSRLSPRIIVERYGLDDEILKLK